MTRVLWHGHNVWSGHLFNRFNFIAYMYRCICKVFLVSIFFRKSFRFILSRCWNKSNIPEYMHLQSPTNLNDYHFVIFCNSTSNKTQKLQWLLHAVLLYFNSLNDCGATFSDSRQHFVWHCLQTLPARTSALTPVVCLLRPLQIFAQLRQHKWNVHPSVDYVVSFKQI